MSDKLEYAVAYKFNRGLNPVFEGTEQEIYKWLAKVDQHSVWEIWDREHGDYETAAGFLARVGDKYKPKPLLTEEDVKRIADGRVREILETISKEADNRASNISDPAMKSACIIVAKLTEDIADRLAENDREKGLGGQ